MTYQLPRLVDRVVTRIHELSPESIVVVRHDARHCRVSLEPDELTVVHESWTPIGWGHWSMVEAVTKQLSWVLRETDVAWVAVLSGQDYPARALRPWERSVATSALDGIVVAEPLTYRPRWGPEPGDGDDAWLRYGYRWFRVPGTGRPWFSSSRASLAAQSVLFRAAVRAEPVVAARPCRTDGACTWGSPVEDRALWSARGGRGWRCHARPRRRSSRRWATRA
jgi:hypothetical protein